jgi:hypothetical protein
MIRVIDDLAARGPAAGDPWAWCPRTPGLTSPMPTPSPRPSSRRSSTAPTSEIGSGPTRTPRPSANGSSPWYNTAHRHGPLGLMTRTTSTRAWPPPSGNSGPRSCAPPTRLTPSASRAGCRSLRRCRRRRKSTSLQPRRLLPCQQGRAHDRNSQISDADCLIPLDNFRLDIDALSTNPRAHRATRGIRLVRPPTRERRR